MNFRNATFFRFPLASLTALEDHFGLLFALGECRLKPVGALELCSTGFVPPTGSAVRHVSDNSDMAVTTQHGRWITLGSEDKILPAPVINDRLARKLEDIERLEGRKPGGRTRKRIKDEILAELLPQAFVSPSRVNAVIHLTHCVVAVDTPSRRKAEEVVHNLRLAMGSFPAMPLTPQVAPRSVMTGWVAGERLPEGLSLGESCELRDPIDHGGVVKISNMELQSQEIQTHLESGKQVVRLGLVLNDRISFVLDESLVVRSIKLLDIALDALHNDEHDDVASELTARMTLMGGELAELFAVIEHPFRLSSAEG